MEAHEHVGTEGYSEGSEAKILGALEDTSATAEQFVVKDDARKKGDKHE